MLGESLTESLDMSGGYSSLSVRATRQLALAISSWASAPGHGGRRDKPMVPVTRRCYIPFLYLEPSSAL